MSTWPEAARLGVPSGGNFRNAAPVQSEPPATTKAMAAFSAATAPVNVSVVETSANMLVGVMAISGADMGPFCSLQTAPRGRQVRVNWNERWRAEACTREPRKLPNTKRKNPDDTPSPKRALLFFLGCCNTRNLLATTKRLSTSWRPPLRRPT